MSVIDEYRSWRSWLPIPTQGYRPNVGRWLLLDGNRYAVTGALLLVNFVTLLVVGTVWTFQLSRLLTETQAVQTVLTAFLSGIILLVSIVVSINSIVLSYDITHLSAQEDRIEGTMEFRREVGRLADADEDPSDPDSFLRVMAEVLDEQARSLADATRGSDEAFVRDVEEFVDSVTRTANRLEQSLDRVVGGQFEVLWLGLELDYGPLMNKSRRLTMSDSGHLDDEAEARLDELMRSLELFATGREYFKTLYYNREISQLSHTLLVVSLPSIIATATSILAIDAQLLPDVWLFGLPPLLTFVAGMFTVALAPFLVLTAFMLRVAKVSRRTAAAGPFVLRS